tara:strand:- start:235 stop:810 length:576 start_codon:yes stop_codon:yes gene_type:complete
MAWSKAGTTTLGSDGETITVSGMTSSKMYQSMTHTLHSGNIYPVMRFNNDSTSQYAWSRYRSSNGSEETAVSQGDIKMMTDNLDSDSLFVPYICNINNEEKLLIGHSVSRNAIGAGSVPERSEIVGKWIDNAEITQINVIDTSTGTLVTDSNVSVLGSDGVESLNVQDGAVYYDTDLNKSYVLYNGAWTEL